MKTICPPVLYLTITLFMLGEMRAVGQAPTVEDFESTDCGTGASATGDCSAAIGSGASASNSNSVAIGELSSASGSGSISIGPSTQATYIGSMAFGSSSVSSGRNAVVIGNNSLGAAQNTLLLGNDLETGSSATNSIIIGTGLNVSTNLYTNSSNVLMIGMNSTVPTFYMTDAGGGSNLSNIGIGTTAPNALLHLKTSGSTELRVENVSSAGTLRFVSGSDEATISQTSNKDLVLSNNKSNKDIIIEGNDGGTLRQMVYIDASTTRVGIGDMSDPSNITAAHTTVVLAETETREKVAKFMVSDNIFGRVQFDNRTDVDNEFGPNIYGVSTLPELEGLYFAGTIETGETSGSTPVIGFDARQQGGFPIPADTRPLFNWSNNNSSRMLMDANGNLGIGTTSPGGKLHVAGSALVNMIIRMFP